jgi:2-polyprenyl-3-methyl-5-hydroxy-6-metoxy-1,4-benzoquinol methylase
MLCKICGSETARVFTADILGKYSAGYFRCKSCGFMQTEDPYWLSESYASAINEIDLGPVSRSLNGSKIVEGVILSMFDKEARFIDYGAGYGVLVRIMRDLGFDFYWHDKYCENIFAKHFVANGETRFELLTAFEVFEHLADPLSEIKSMLAFSNNLLFSTLLVPSEAQKAGDWWYFGPEHGQHVAFYTVDALQVIAKVFNLHLSTDGVGMHLLSQKPVSNRLFRFFAHETRQSKLARRLLRTRMRKRSLLLDDFLAVSGHRI